MYIYVLTLHCINRVGFRYIFKIMTSLKAFELTLNFYLQLPAEAKKYLQTTCPTSICMGLVFPQVTLT